jgi:hypothetical protein
MKVQFSFLSGQWQSYFGYIPNLYNLAGFFKSFGQIARSAPLFPVWFCNYFLDKGIVESILRRNQRSLIHGIIYCRHFSLIQTLP